MVSVSISVQCYWKLEERDSRVMQAGGLLEKQIVSNEY